MPYYADSNDAARQREHGAFAYPRRLRTGFFCAPGEKAKLWT